VRANVMGILKMWPISGREAAKNTYLP